MAPISLVEHDQNDGRKGKQGKVDIVWEAGTVLSSGRQVENCDRER